MKQVYLDNAATTAIRPEVVDRMIEVLKENYGNASSTHSFGRSSKALLEQCRKNIAGYFNALPSEIIFTSGGTEADNLALRSAVRDLGVKEIVTSKIEHHAVLHTVEQLHKEYNVSIHYVNIDANGFVDYNHLESLLSSSNKVLVSLMHVNNEVGNLLDIDKVATLCQKHKALFHSDMVQSVGHFTVDVQQTPIDFFAASAHKFHGPKGVGFCYIRKDSGIKPLIFGGEQERGYRAGTEAVHNIIGMDEALSMAYKNIEVEKKHISKLKSYFIEQLKKNFKNISFNGGCDDLDNSTYTLVNVCLPISPEKAPMLQFQLDLKGIACSKGSACQSGSTQQSHVLSAILPDDKLKFPSVRFSFSIYTTKEQIDYTVDVLKEIISA